MAAVAILAFGCTPGTAGGPWRTVDTECGNGIVETGEDCDDANTVDDIQRLQDMGVTDLQVTPWSENILAEMGVGAIMQQQPSLQVKQDAIQRYADEVIVKFN